MMHLAKRAIYSYLKCVYLMKDKEVFKFQEIDTQKLSESMGLVTTPEIDFAQSGTQLTNTMSRSEQRAARIKMLREAAKKRKEEKL